MSEYSAVERPFLQKLKQLGWEIIDHGAGGIPQDPAASKRHSFRELVLEDVFKENLKRINATTDGRPWLTDAQVDGVLRELTEHSGEQLLEVNKAVHELLTSNTVVHKNELTGEQSPEVRLIDFKNPRKNHFLAVNQYRVDTPGAAREAIIPDIVLFVNGIPLVVIECKDKDTAEPLSNAFIQITRYENRRDDPYAVQEGEEKLFHGNLFSIITYGEEARFGTITGEFEHYLNWKDIFPEEYRTIQVSPHEERQDVLIHGMLHPEILLDILKSFTVFMDLEGGGTAKIVCRYQQYRAVYKIMERLRTGATPFEKSGVVWHTQGSGKSLTMVFLVRKMRESDDLKDYKIIIVNDRNDLEDQLSGTAALTGETVNIIAHRRDLPALKDDSSDLSMVMLHKFLAQNGVSAQSLIDSGVVPKFEAFETINNGERILVLIDEAHRTQGGEMGDNLFTGFPNAVKIAFTGTPLLTERHKQLTHERFGRFIDVYKMSDAVADRATVDILYIGRTSKDQILNKEMFRGAFDDMFKERTEEERQEIQRRYGTLTAYLESKDRIAKIAADMLDHYIREVLPNGFKAQVVACSITAACRYKYELERELKDRIAAEEAKDQHERDEELLKQLRFLKVGAVVTMMENNEPGYISAARKEAIENNAKDNFKKDFNYEKPETAYGILCVCDRLLTGFDAPVEQVMYLDKNLREHDLMQAIARVNRTKVMKSGLVKAHGIVVDYYGVAQHLKEALAIYTETDEKELGDLTAYFRGLENEIPVLEARYRRLLQLFQERKVSDIEAFVTQSIGDETKEWDIAETCISLAEDVKFRAQFDTYIKAFYDSLDLLFNASLAREYYIPAKRFGYLLMRMRNRFQDKTLDLKWAGAKVRKLIDAYLHSMGVDPMIPPVKLLADDFPKIVDDQNKSKKAKASEMEHAIRWHIKVNLQKDPALYTRFSERLQRIMDQHKEHWDTIVLELTKLREDMKQGRVQDTDFVPASVAPFMDLIALEAGIDRDDLESLKSVAPLAVKIFQICHGYLSIPNIWQKSSECKRWSSEVHDELEYCGIKGVAGNAARLTVEIVNLAKNREGEILKSDA